MHRQTFFHCSQEVKACALQFQPSDLTHVMVAIAMIGGERDEVLIQAILKQCTQNLPAYSPGLLSGILWALGEMESTSAGRCVHHFLKCVCVSLLLFPVSRISALDETFGDALI